MTRRCSHCSHNGHNARTCPNRGVKVFGVRLDHGSMPMRKSVSMGNLSLIAGAANGGPEEREKDGYASEDFVKGSSSSCRERKKGIPWTEQEHKKFLLGLQKLGKGDWRGISKNFVVTRTPTQVASHAQKHFIRQLHATRRKRRSSLFDMNPDEFAEDQPFPMSGQEPEPESSHPVPTPPSLDATHESSSSSSTLVPEPPPYDAQPFPSNIQSSIPMQETMQYPYAVMYPSYPPPPFFPYPYPVWPYYRVDAVETKVAHEVVKPTAVHSKAPIDVDHLVGMSKLSLGDGGCEPGSLQLQLNLLGDGERHSAFHSSNPHASSSGRSSSSSPIHAV